MRGASRREQQIAKLPPGAKVLTVCFVRPGDPVRDPVGKKPAPRGSAAAGEAPEVRLMRQL
jgi:hypothetical protein